MSRLAWSISELVEDGCVGKSTAVYEHIAAGRLEAYKLGRRTLVTDESVRKLMRSLPRWKPSGVPPDLKSYQERKRQARPAEADAA